MRENFFKNHIDTIAIVSANLAIAAMLLSLIISNNARIDAQNSRADTLYTIVIDLIKEAKDNK